MSGSQSEHGEQGHGDANRDHDDQHHHENSCGGPSGYESRSPRRHTEPSRHPTNKNSLSTHSHSHSHNHGGGDAHSPQHRQRLAIALGITATVFIAEVIGAIVTGSLALLVDAAHMLTDTSGLVIALIAASLINRPASDARTWSWKRAEVLAAELQALVLLVVGIYALVEGVHRLIYPPEVTGGLLLVFGVIGLIANIASIMVLSSGRQANLNMRAAFLEVANDALGSLGVIIAAGVIALTGWTRADAIAGLIIACLILPRALKILSEAGAILLEATPSGLDIASVREHIEQTPRVVAVQDLHASLIATGLPVVSAHVVIEDECFHDGGCLDVLDDLQDCLASHFDISVEHSTFQLEPAGHAGHEPHLEL